MFAFGIKEPYQAAKFIDKFQDAVAPHPYRREQRSVILYRGDGMSWQSTAKAATALNMSLRTVQRHCKAGKLRSRLVSGHGGNGKVIEVWIGTEFAKEENEKLKTVISRFEKVPVSEIGAKDASLDEKQKSCQRQKVAPEKPLFQVSTTDQRQLNDRSKICNLLKYNELQQDQRQLKKPAPENTVSGAGLKSTLANSCQGWSYLKDQRQLNDRSTTSQRQTNDNSTTDQRQLLAPENSDSITDRSGKSPVLEKEWIPLEFVNENIGYSRRTLFRKIKAGKIERRVIVDGHNKNGRRSFLNAEDLPPETLKAWREFENTLKEKKTVGVLPVVSHPERKTDRKKKETFESFDLASRRQALARLELVKGFNAERRYARKRKLNVGERLDEWAKKVNCGELFPDIWSELGIPEISARTVRRWSRTYELSGDGDYPVSLIDKRRLPKGRESEVRVMLKSLVRKYGAKFDYMTVAEIGELVACEYRRTGEEMPVSLRTLSLYVKKAREDNFLKAYLCVKKEGNQWYYFGNDPGQRQWNPFTPSSSERIVAEVSGSHVSGITEFRPIAETSGAGSREISEKTQIKSISARTVLRSEFYGVKAEALTAISSPVRYHCLQFEVLTPCILNGVHLKLSADAPVTRLSVYKFHGEEAMIKIAGTSSYQHNGDKIDGLDLKLGVGKYSVAIYGNNLKSYTRTATGIYAGFKDNLHLRLVAGGSTPAWNKVNKWHAREQLRTGKIRLETDNPRLLEDLTAPRYSIRADKKIEVESKDKIKKRIGRSTDAGDAFVYALWMKFLKENTIKPSARVSGRRVW